MSELDWYYDMEGSPPKKAKMEAPYYSKENIYSNPPRPPPSSRFAPSQNRNYKSNKLPADKRIHEILEENLALQLSKSCRIEPAKTDGDVPQLNRHSSFFVQGVKVGWPFPQIMTPQRQMAIHLIQALKNKRHVVLESPTGTGKSAAILCSVLAWQRHHFQKLLNEANPLLSNEESPPRPPTIIYCSRTHSQVAQMVASLRKTPYRPKMTVLGSRDRLCIHEPLSDTHQNRNDACRVRVRNTNAQRTRMYKNAEHFYSDENPPTYWEEDMLEAPQDGPDRTQKPTCPHYRQLTSQRTVELALDRLFPPTTSCACGGEDTHWGTHDVEDLVNFGKDPHRVKVAIYKDAAAATFGLALGWSDHERQVCIAHVHEHSAAHRAQTVQPGDILRGVNGQSLQGLTPDQAANLIQQTPSNRPLLLDITRGGTFVPEGDVSSVSPCPYYLSHRLAQHAELIFCPYNYVLDPSIRQSLGLTLKDAVVVLDEAHNVESTLRDSGSGSFGEFELMDFVVLLSFYASGTPQRKENGEESLVEMAHALLVFVEKLIYFMIEAKTDFEQRPTGAAKALADWEKYHTPDKTEFDMTFDGPTGYGTKGKAVGCLPFLERIGIEKDQMEILVRFGATLENEIRSSDDPFTQRNSVLVDKLNSLLSLFVGAANDPEHYFVASTARANGTLDFAAGAANGTLVAQRENKRHPKSLPLVLPRNGQQPRAQVPACPMCKHVTNGCNFIDGAVRHGDYCNGNMPPWEAVLVLELLSPSTFMKPLREQCHSVILASGSLAPIPSLCAELGLDPADESSKTSAPRSRPASLPEFITSTVTELLSGEQAKKAGARLQVKPKPLEANHVINLDKQLLAVSIGNFEDGSTLTVSYSHWSKPNFFSKLGGAIAAVVESIPRGGVLVFLPSYNILKKCAYHWRQQGGRQEQSWFSPPPPNSDDGDDQNVWDRLLASKGKVIIEPTGSQEEFEQARDEYAETIRRTGSCILLAVYRGKMSEGISFNDDFARGVICVGIPYPNNHDKAVKAKKSYNDEQRRVQKRTDVLPGNEWYSQQAYRAIAQALGRCIRHKSDYGVVVLMDSRHCHDGAPVDGDVCRAHRPLPKWMRHSVRTLSMRGPMSPGDRSISGGWRGFRTEMARFFEGASQYVKSGCAATQPSGKGTLSQGQSNTTSEWTATPKRNHNGPSVSLGESQRLASTGTIHTPAHAMHTPTRNPYNRTPLGSGATTGSAVRNPYAARSVDSKGAQ